MTFANSWYSGSPPFARAMKLKKLAPSSPQASAAWRSGEPSSMSSAMDLASATETFDGRPGAFFSSALYSSSPKTLRTGVQL